MSEKIKDSKDVTNEALASRLFQLSKAVTKGQKSIDKEFYMSIPPRFDNDADLILHEAAKRLSVDPDFTRR